MNACTYAYLVECLVFLDEVVGAFESDAAEGGEVVAAGENAHALKHQVAPVHEAMYHRSNISAYQHISISKISWYHSIIICSHHHIIT